MCGVRYRIGTHGNYGTYGQVQLVSVTRIDPIRFAAPSASLKKQIISLLLARVQLLHFLPAVLSRITPSLHCHAPSLTPNLVCKS